MKKQVRISQFNYVIFYLPVYIAQEKGFFPFDIIFENKNSDELVVEDVLKGKADISIGDPIIAEYKRYKDKVVCVGIILNKFPLWAISLNPLAKKIKSPILFKGFKIGSYPKPSTMYMILKKVLKENNLNIEKDVEIINLKGNRELGPLYGGETDICIVSEPIISQALSNGAKIVMKLDEKFDPMCISGFTCQKNADKKMVRDFLLGVKKGLDIIYNNENETLRICKKYFPDIDEKSLLYSIKHLKKQGWTRSLKIDKKEWINAIKIRDEIKKTTLNFTNSL